MGTHVSATSAQLVYGLDDRPPIGRAIALASQHVLTMFGSTVAVPLFFGPQLWPVPEELPETVRTQLSEMQLINTALLISSVMLCSGVATLLQSTWGSRLPIIQGVSFSFWAAFIGIVAATHNVATVDWSAVIAGDTSEATLQPLLQQWESAGALGMRTIAGAVLVGGLIEAVIGFTRLMGMVRSVLSPVVIGPVIMLIGLALYQFGAPFAAGNWYVSGATMLLIVLFAFVFSRHVRLLQLFPMLSAIVIVVTSCWLLGQQGAIAPSDAAYVDISAFQHADWLRTSNIFFPLGFS